MPRTAGMRIAIAQLLMAIFFVSLILVIDPIVGDAVVRWMALGYILVNGLVVALWLPAWMAARRGEAGPGS